MSCTKKGPGCHAASRLTSLSDPINDLQSRDQRRILVYCDKPEALNGEELTPLRWLPLANGHSKSRAHTTMTSMGLLVQFTDYHFEAFMRNKSCLCSF